MMTKLEEYGWHLATARKAGRCDCCNCQNCGGPGHYCAYIIQPKERYVSGEFNSDAGGYGRDRYCMPCATAMGLL